MKKLVTQKSILLLNVVWEGVYVKCQKISSKVNNEFCPDYDPKKPKVYIKYLDMSNLYGGAMSEYLPYGGYKWVKVNNRVVIEY